MIIYNITRQVLIDKTASWSSGMILALGKSRAQLQEAPRSNRGGAPLFFKFLWPYNSQMNTECSRFKVCRYSRHSQLSAGYCFAA
ncbi:hypothetical protein M3J07_002195 [Ascochyta lentis]